MVALNPYSRNWYRHALFKLLQARNGSVFFRGSHKTLHFYSLKTGNWKLLYFVFSPKLKKLNISLISKAIIIISVSLPMVNTYKFCKTKFLIQSPGEPWEQHLGDVALKKFELHKISLKTKWPEGSIYSGAFLRKIHKKLTGTEKPRFWLIYLKIFKNLLFLVLFLHF